MSGAGDISFWGNDIWYRKSRDAKSALSKAFWDIIYADRTSEDWQPQVYWVVSSLKLKWMKLQRRDVSQRRKRSPGPVNIWHVTSRCSNSNEAQYCKISSRTIWKYHCITNYYFAVLLPRESSGRKYHWVNIMPSWRFSIIYPDHYKPTSPFYNGAFLLLLFVSSSFWSSFLRKSSSTPNAVLIRPTKAHDNSKLASSDSKQKIVSLTLFDLFAWNMIPHRTRTHPYGVRRWD